MEKHAQNCTTTICHHIRLCTTNTNIFNNKKKDIYVCRVVRVFIYIYIYIYMYVHYLYIHTQAYDI